MKSLLTCLYLSIFIPGLSAQPPKLPNRKETKEFMAWFTSEYFKTIDFKYCLNEKMIGPDSMLMWDDSSEWETKTKVTLPYYGAFTGTDLDYARKQTLILLQRSEYFDSVFLAQIDSSEFLKFSSRDQKSGYRWELVQTMFSDKWTIYGDRWSAEFIPIDVDLVLDTAMQHVNLSNSETNRCGQWVSYPIFSEDYSKVFLIYSNDGGLDHVHSVLFRNFHGEWLLTQSYSPWD